MLVLLLVQSVQRCGCRCMEVEELGGQVSHLEKTSGLFFFSALFYTLEFRVRLQPKPFGHGFWFFKRLRLCQTRKKEP
jgi:hypothetical protein